MSDLPEDEWHVYDLIDAVQGQSNPNYEMLAQVLAAADRLVRLHQNLPEAHFLRGWALYYLWDYNFGDAREALDEMQLVLRLDPSHQWALWFAIVLSAVLGDNGMVVGLFDRLDRAFFADEGKDWRYLKSWEYALCSHVRLGHIDVFAVGLKSLIQEFVKVANDPEEILERPNQLMAIYKELRSNSSKSLLGSDRKLLVNLLEGQLALLVSGGWIGSEELGSANGEK